MARVKKANVTATHNKGIVRADAPIPYTNRQMLIPADAKYERIPDAKLEQFLTHRTEGDSDTKAARLIGVDLRAVKYWLRVDQRFADAYEDALVHAIDCNEDRVMDLCRDGNISALKLWLEAMRPDRWSRVKTQIVAGDNNHVQTLIINSDDEKQRLISEMPEMTIEHEQDEVSQSRRDSKA